MPRTITKTALTKKSQITLPKKVREALHVGPGDQVTFEVDGENVRIVPLPSRLDQNFGKVKPRKKPEDFAALRKEFEEKVGQDTAKER
ncbi:MAG: AbrB/MazE/SpoVT family DNA-binding domain-containing protein [Chloroflexi bacterium]|nr:AbrB/MazE/SpoVT family DNA-binding domain-containing protein [Chloroflexota bacterium]